jgi:hypothetical protein
VANHVTIPDEEFFDNLSYHDLEDMIDDIVDNNNITDLMVDPYVINQMTITTVKPDFQMLHPLFGWFPAETIKRTFNVTTQFALGRVSDTLK